MGGRTRSRQGSQTTSTAQAQAPAEEGFDQAYGNAAAQDEIRMLETGIDAGAVELSGGEPSTSGSVRARPGDDGRIAVDAPRIDFRATANLVDSVQLPGDAFVQFGLTQTILGSDRSLVYEQGGREVLRKQLNTPESRDAIWQETDDGGMEAQAPEPFYNVPTHLTEVRRSATSSTYDQPGFDTPAHEGGARLARVEGSDRFISGWAVKRDGQVVQLGSYAWSVPWDVEVSEDLTGRGSGIEHAESEVDPSTLTGEIAVNTTSEWMEIPSVEAAMALDPNVLFRAMAQAAGHDEDTVAHAREALRRRDPTLQLTLYVDDTAEWFSGDDIAITVTGSRSATTETQTLNDDEHGTFTLRFSQILDADSLGPGTVLEISAQDGGWVGNDAATLPWAFPFHDASEAEHMHSSDDTVYRLAAVWTG